MGGGAPDGLCFVAEESPDAGGGCYSAPISTSTAAGFRRSESALKRRLKEKKEVVRDELRGGNCEAKLGDGDKAEAATVRSLEAKASEGDREAATRLMLWNELRKWSITTFAEFPSPSVLCGRDKDT